MESKDKREIRHQQRMASLNQLEQLTVKRIHNLEEDLNSKRKELLGGSHYNWKNLLKAELMAKDENAIPKVKKVLLKM